LSPRETPLRVDPSFGWHLYGSDLCLQARHLGLPVVAVDALCMHNSLTGSAGDAYRASEAVLADKWADDLPLHLVISSVYGPPERRRMERLESERTAAVDELERVRAELDRVRHDLSLIEASRVWRVRGAVRGLLDRPARQ